MIILISAIFAFAGCKEPDKKNKLPTSDILKDTSVFGSYLSEPSDGGSGIILNSDSTYAYHFGSCLASGRDSGKYSLRSDTLYFASYLKAKSDTLKGWFSMHGQVTPLTKEKYLIKKGKIYFRMENENYIKTAFWLKKGLETDRVEKLDSLGNGYAKLYNINRQLSKNGYFKSFKLFNGESYTYTADGLYKKIVYYKNGIVFNDTLIALVNY